MNELRQELTSAEQELSQIRNEKDLLLNQLDLHHRKSSSSPVATKNISSSGFESIQERSEDDERSCTGSPTQIDSHQQSHPHHAIKVNPSESSLFHHAWQIERITQRDGFFTSTPMHNSSKTDNNNVSYANPVKQTKSMQKIPILLNSLFGGFNNDSASAAASIQYQPTFSRAMLNTNNLPLRKTISLELPNRFDVMPPTRLITQNNCADRSSTTDVNNLYLKKSMTKQSLFFPAGYRNYIFNGQSWS